MAADSEEMKAWLRGLVAPRPGETFVDLGCGKGDDLNALAVAFPESLFIGLDQSEEWVRRAGEATPANATFRVADVAQRLPLDDASIDGLLSINLLECVADQAGLISECSRVLRPGGQIVMAHYDWDTQTFDGPDRAFVRRIVHAFSDWQQAWMPAIDPWTGRRLHRLFAADGRFQGEVFTRTLVSVDAPESYGWRQAESFAGLVRRGLVPAEDYEAFMEFQRAAAEQGEFFYSVTMYAFVGQKAVG